MGIYWVVGRQTSVVGEVRVINVEVVKDRPAVQQMGEGCRSGACKLIDECMRDVESKVTDEM